MTRKTAHKLCMEKRTATYAEKVILNARYGTTTRAQPMTVWKAATPTYHNGRRRDTHHLKCERTAFAAVKLGAKRAEYCATADRCFAEGDMIVLYCLNSHGAVEEYSPTLQCRITHIQTDFLPVGYAMLSFKLSDGDVCDAV